MRGLLVALLLVLSAGLALAAELVYFTDPFCPECGQSRPLLEKALAAHPEFTLREIDVSRREGLAERHKLEEAAGIPVLDRGHTPAVLVGNRLIYGLDQFARLSEILAEPASRSAPPVTVTGKASLWLVLLAGLADGVNPCAAAAVLFFAAMMTRMGKGRKGILLLGGGFLVGFVLGYLLLGVGLLAGLKSILVGQGVASALYGLFGLACLGLAILAFRDAARTWRSGKAEVSLQLPAFLKRVEHRLTRWATNSRWLLPAGFSLGFALTLVSFVCTGQLYIPVLTGLASAKTSIASSFPLLLLYNLAFAIPTALVLVACAAGVGSERLGAFFSRKVAASRLAMGIAFMLLGVWLLELAWKSRLLVG